MNISNVVTFLLLLFSMGALGTRGQPTQSSTRSPHESGLTACESCHTASGWKPIRNIVDFDHDKTKYPLRRSHQGIGCRQCHTKLVFSNVGSKCADCHADIHRRQFGAQCEQCHTVKGFHVSLQEVRLHQNRFPLLGAHAALDCSSCHRSAAAGQFQGLPTECISCHALTFERTTLPNHRASGLPTNCQQCHNSDTWAGASFDHSRFSGFSLTGAHARLQCSECHAGGRFQGADANCVTCHAKDYSATKNPDHVKANFPRECSQCHTTGQWLGAKFDHNAFARFQLTGAHLNASCAQCHLNGRYAGTPKDCFSCHQGDYGKASSPNHVAAGFPQDCTVCHTTSQWAGAKFDHSRTRFPLTGMHLSASCTQCHSSGRFAGLDASCASCHLNNYNATRNPDHRAAGFPQQCAQCHTTGGWSPASFNHSGTAFPLTGAHLNANCTQCHANGRYTGTPKDCASCHLANYNGTRNPNHQTAGFPQQCELCHSPMGWSPARFNHTSFTLTGAHVGANCTQCHANGRYAGTPRDCASCHQADYNRTTNPNHVAAAFPLDCSLCHNTTQFAGARFDHSRNRFPLTGAHVSQPCASCHASGQYAGLNTACSSCHINQYNSVRNPDHRAANFPLDCAQCHNTTSFTGASFNHNLYARFQLTGAHLNVACAQCHVNGRYTGTPRDCASCHLTRYQSTTNPNHVAAGFPTDCSVCHSTAGWAGARFDHSRNRFPLVGAHTTVACSSCHASGQYAGLNTACSSCHLNRYNATLNPNHRTAGFPLQCEICHTPVAWTPSTFDHNRTAFPLTGVHTRTACASCHIGGRYAGTPTACYSCHKTEYDSVTNPNHAAAGFPTTCTQCHNTSGWSGATFNHTRFPIYSGTHARRWTTCSECHPNASNFTVFTCFTCHTKAQTDSKHGGVRNYVYNSSNCYACHPQGTAG